MSYDWSQFHPLILQLESEGLVTRTFRRLDPERQGEVLLAILEEAIEVGPAALNIKRVAGRAGVAVGSLYAYFPDRDRMLDFAVELSVRYLVAELDRYRPYLASLPLRAGLSAYLQGGVEWSREQAALLQFFARAAYHGPGELGERLVRPVAETLLGIVREMLRVAAERGEVRPGVDLETASRLVHALLVAVGDAQLLPYLNTYFQVYSPETSPEKALEALLDLLQSGIS